MTPTAHRHLTDDERECTSLRCGDDCWGLLNCQHPDRTPFYATKFRVGRFDFDTPEGQAYFAVVERQVKSGDPGHIAPLLTAVVLMLLVVLGALARGVSL